MMMTPPDLPRLLLASVVIVLVALFVVRAAAALIGFYLVAIGALFLRGHPLASTVVTVAGGALLGALGAAVYHAIAALLEWLL